MKKFICACLIFLVTGCASDNAQEEVKFKNPVFYNKMIPEKGGPDLILTPTWAKYDMHEDGFAEGPCELLANEESYIIITCTIHALKFGYTDVYKNKYEALYDCATIEDIVQSVSNDDVCSVKKYSYRGNTDKISGWSFYTTQKPIIQKTK